MQDQESRKRGRYSHELKQQTLAECDAPRALVAKVALSPGITDIFFYDWRKPVASIATCVQPCSASQSISLSNSAVVVPKLRTF